jgi:lysophospholipase L1-like esterase
MTRLASRLFAVMILTLFAAGAHAADFSKVVKSLELNDGDCVVFLGDSITHQCLYTQYVEDFFYTRFPDKRIVFHNAGVGGAQAWDALQRIDRDVLAYKPKYVTILLGMNDGRYVPFDQAIFDTYTKDMTEVVEKINASGATPIPMTPTMFDARAARMKDRNGPREEFYNSVLAYYGTWLRDVAEQNGFGFVDMWSPLNNITIAQRKTDPNFTLIQDAVHPGPSGQLVMAFAILEDMGLRGPVSTIRIDATPDKPKGNGRGGKLTDLTRSDDGLSFTWHAESLPFVVPDEAQLGAKLLKLGHKASREALTVNGLAAGEYELLIDGTSVGKYPANRLAAGVELQENDKTPQYQQAKKVAELNKQRNDGPVHALRGEWGRFQGYARKKRQVAENPSDAKAAEELKKIEEQMQGMEDRVQKAEADAKAIEDQIFQINQPQPHKYELRRLERREVARRQAVVSGRVTLKGQPLAGAQVTFIGKNTQLELGTTDEEGRFQLEPNARRADVSGQYRVTVEGDGVSERFSDREKTALTVEVLPGQNEFDFSLQ